VDSDWLYRGQGRPVVVDEGGVRIVDDGVSRYVPFTNLVGATLVTPLLGRSRLVVTRDTGMRHVTRLPSNVDTRHIIPFIEMCRDEARMTRREAARERGELGGWIAAVAAGNVLRRNGSFYRDAMGDVQRLATILSDASEENEARAAAAHALLMMGQREFVKRHTTHLSPPLVVAAVRLAPSGEAFVSDALLDEIVPFLELRDRIVFTQRLRVA
jgi:hypothetical protein